LLSGAQHEVAEQAFVSADLIGDQAAPSRMAIETAIVRIFEFHRGLHGSASRLLEVFPADGG
jgi:hypothetical protein